MGLEWNQGNLPRWNNTQRVPVTSDTFSLFDDIPATSSKPSAPAGDAGLLAQINAIQTAMTQQNAICAALMKEKDF